jgi:hypothetical protein
VFHTHSHTLRVTHTHTHTDTDTDTDTDTPVTPLHFSAQVCDNQAGRNDEDKGAESDQHDSGGSHEDNEDFEKEERRSSLSEVWSAVFVSKAEEDEDSDSCQHYLPALDTEYLGDEDSCPNLAGSFDDEDSKVFQSKKRLSSQWLTHLVHSLRVFVVFIVTSFSSLLSYFFNRCYIVIEIFSHLANTIRHSYHHKSSNCHGVRVGILNGSNWHRQITIRRSNQPTLACVISGSDSYYEFTNHQEAEFLWRSRRGNHNTDEIVQYYVAMQGGAGSDSDSDSGSDAGGSNIHIAAEMVEDEGRVFGGQDQDFDNDIVHGLEDAEEHSETASFSPDTPVDTDGQNRLINAAEMELYCLAFFKRSDIKNLLLRKNSKKKRILKYFGYTKLFITFCFWKKGADAKNSSDLVTLQLTEYMRVLLSDGREDDGITPLKKEDLSHIKLIATAKNLEEYLCTHFTLYYKK